MSKEKDTVTDKKFLKRNDFAMLLERLTEKAKDYKNPLIALGVLAFLILLAYPFYNIYLKGQHEDFREAYYQASQTPEFEDDKALIAKHPTYPATSLLVMNIADDLMEKGEVDAALKMIDETLSRVEEPSLMSTMLSLKKLNALKNHQPENVSAFMTEADGYVITSYKARFLTLGAEFLLANGKGEEAKSLYDEALSLVSESEENIQNFDDMILKNEIEKDLLYIQLSAEM
jgi:predicted negative regulator of RcsB-dependent stress response